MRKAVLIFIINLVTFIFCIFIGELYLRIKGKKPYIRTFPGQRQNKVGGVRWAQSDDSLGWTCNKTDPEINPQGFRDKKNFDTINKASGKKRIMILGDSFMYGVGAGINENVPNLLEIMLKDRYEVFNLGVPGWGIDQMYLAYQKYKDVIDPQIVILAFIEDDVTRVLEAYRIYEGMNKPSFTIKNEKLVFRTIMEENKVSFDKIMVKSVFLSRIVFRIYLVNVARPIAKTIFLEMAEETKNRNEKFIVMRIPNKENSIFIKNFIWNLKSFKKTFSHSNVKYLEPLEEMTKIPNWHQEFYLNDGHMSAAGNKFLADYVYKHIFTTPYHH